MINREVYVINGWSIKGRTQVKQLEDELYKINEDYMNDLDRFYIYDGMCGEYAYFGANLGSIDVDYDDPTDMIINEKSLIDANEKLSDFLEKHPEYAEVFQKYSNNDQPQVMVVLHIY